MRNLEAERLSAVEARPSYRRGGCRGRYRRVQGQKHLTQYDVDVHVIVGDIVGAAAGAAFEF